MNSDQKARKTVSDDLQAAMKIVVPIGEHIDVTPAECGALLVTLLTPEERDQLARAERDTYEGRLKESGDAMREVGRQIAKHVAPTAEAAVAAIDAVLRRLSRK